jgi:membrane-bound ClpP family serine protease
MWPVILIALGVLFLLHEFLPGWGLGKTWPVILVLIGVLRLVDMSRPPRPPEGPRV